MQGDPLDMILYGISMLPLTLDLKLKVPTALQPWYIYGAAVGIIFHAIDSVFNLPIKNG